MVISFEEVLTIIYVVGIYRRVIYLYIVEVCLAQDLVQEEFDN